MRSIPIVVAALALGLSLTANAAETKPAADAPTAAGASTSGQPPFDLQFIDTMIVHHRGAADMAQLGQEKAERPELKSLAEKIKTDAEKEIAQMEKWREQWFARAARAEQSAKSGVEELPQDMTKLKEATGHEFDELFIAKMTQHHENGITLAKDARAKAQHKPLKDFSAKMIKEQNQDLKKLQGMAKRRTAS